MLEELNIPCGKLKDETEYLLSTEKNKNSIIKSIEQLESGETHQFVFPKI
ncbi:MAG: hypothetical protein IPJ39_05815 [Saprospiraceae bacterium]|nr:hypothetical protein [Saprospiraceae bacterium]